MPSERSFRKGLVFLSYWTKIFIVPMILLIDFKRDHLFKNIESAVVGIALDIYHILHCEFTFCDINVINNKVKFLQNLIRSCQILDMKAFEIYPLPSACKTSTSVLVLQPDLLRQPPDLRILLKPYRYTLLLPDGARCSSPAQLLDLVEFLNSVDSTVVAVGVGGEGGSSPLTCHHYKLDVAAWTLIKAPVPDATEACDAVSGRAAMMLTTMHLLQITQSLLRPLPLSLGIQGAARGWKVHIERGGRLGEGRQLYDNQHLQWKRESAEEERRKILFSALGIKKVVEAGGKVQWYGCNKSTPRCFPSVVGDTPEYLYRGRWTPPCCLEGLRIVARHVFEVLRGCRARWWLEGGSLLGAVRHGDIIPWDYDVDIGIYATDIDRCPQVKSSRWQTLEDTQGFVWQKATEGNFYRVHYSAANHLHVDIFPFSPHGGMMMRNGAWSTGHQQDVDFPEHYLRPLSSITFAGVLASAPNNVRDFLEFKFGSGSIENPQYPNPDIMHLKCMFHKHNISVLT
ncbi:unnamed protein product, partial [Meganyctiphanes norvegica]